MLQLPQEAKEESVTQTRAFVELDSKGVSHQPLPTIVLVLSPYGNNLCDYRDRLDRKELTSHDYKIAFTKRISVTSSKYKYSVNL